VEETATKLLNDRFPAFHSRFSTEIVDVEQMKDDLVAVVEKTKVRDVLQFLKTEPSLKFEVMMDLFGMDYLKYEPEKRDRFAVVYNLYSMTFHRRVFVKCYLSEKECEIDSIHDIFAAANWFEREAWDLFGVNFKGHPYLIRILCHNDFVGHPLRKDYPSNQYQRLKTAATSAGI
jgi:NADH/F420H2 dehydrogenase subunit C